LVPNMSLEGDPLGGEKDQGNTPPNMSGSVQGGFCTIKLEEGFRGKVRRKDYSPAKEGES